MFLRSEGKTAILAAARRGDLGDRGRIAALKAYANEKGNLRFPYDKPVPYGLIARVVKARVKENAEAFERKGDRRAVARNAKR